VSDLAIRVIAADDPVVPAIARLMVDAFPLFGITSADALARAVTRLRETFDDPGTRRVVAERDGVAVGTMRLHDYVMNLRGVDATAGGLGAVAVSLAHKRQGIARAMIAWYLEDYRRRGATTAILHPFRPDFYRRVGFGHGTPIHRYAFRPSALRDGGARGTARLLDENDLDAILALDRRLHRRTNGAIEPHAAPLVRALADVGLRHVGIDDGGELRGFMQTMPILGSKETTNRNRLAVRDLTYEEPEHLAALLGYLRAQQDQFTEVVIESQDPALYLATDDPRDRSDRSLAPPAVHRVTETGLGMQYRVLDLERAFAHLPSAAEPLVLRVEVDDAFFPPTAGATTFRFGPAGPPSRANAAAPDATLTIGIADLSSLVVGSLALPPLLHHRLASVEPAGAANAVAALFRADEPPTTATRF
jgi:predicted N-acetyltransferase YhbS